MIPIYVSWTEFTAIKEGRAWKLVPCENCETEYVYEIKREGFGLGVAMYGIDSEGAATNAIASADEALREYLANDFDAVPCPVCGQYQQFMFSKLNPPTPGWYFASVLAMLFIGVGSALSLLSAAVNFLDRPSETSLLQMAVSLGALLVVAGVGYWMTSSHHERLRSFDPNEEDQQSRIALGKSRAVARGEFEERIRQSSTNSD